MKAIWNDQILAESDDTVVVEGNHYFPSDSINNEFYYYDVVVNGERNKNAAWFYPETKDAANNIKGRIAFWHGAEVSN